jgi:hypothetical protein
MKTNLMKAPKENGTLILKRTFNQSDFNGGFIKYWRIVGPANHPNLNSDISQLWLAEHGVKIWGD